MLKSIKLDYFTDGFSMLTVNCIDIPIAAACGFYQHNNYFYYLFKYCIANNWSIGSNDWHTYKNIVINDMGLSMERHKIGSYSELLSFISEKIEGNQPIILPVKYKALSYTQGYTTDNSTHFILVTAYDPDRKIVVIRESPHCIGDIYRLYMNDNRGLFPLQLKESILEEAWDVSNYSFAEEQSLLNNTVFSMEKIGLSSISSYQDLIMHYLANYNSEYSKFSDAISLIKNASEKINIDKYIKNLRQEHLHSIIIFFDILELCFKDRLVCDKDFKNALLEYKEKHLKFKLLLISKLHADILRGKDIDYDRYMNDIILADNELYSFICGLNLAYMNSPLVNMPQNRRLKNYSKDVIVYVDSFRHEKFRGPNGFDGNRSNGWWSADNDSTHWIMFDLGKPKLIFKIVLKHWIEPLRITRDFYIQGSNNESEWINLDVVYGNEKEQTVHEFSPVKFRYVRIYITHSCIIDNIAKIVSFDIIGYDEE